MHLNFNYFKFLASKIIKSKFFDSFLNHCLAILTHNSLRNSFSKPKMIKKVKSNLIKEVKGQSEIESIINKKFLIL